MLTFAMAARLDDGAIVATIFLNDPTTVYTFRYDALSREQLLFNQDLDSLVVNVGQLL